jgi:stage II sporulation protein D
MPTRRNVLAQLGAAMVTASFTELVWTGHARASDLSLSDRIDLLYSNQFHFNERGQPQISVGLMEAQTEVVLSAPKGIRVLPSGDGGTSIVGGKRFRVSLTAGTPAKQTWSVVLEELVGPHAMRPDAAIERWTARGYEPHDEEVGTVFGVEGHVLDNRRVLVTSGRWSSEAAALEAAQLAKRKHGAVAKLHPIIRERAKGAMVAVDLDTKIEIQADGVLWFQPVGEGPITVHDVLSGTTMGKQHRDDRKYGGSVYVAIDRHGKLAVANLISETDVLAGLVPAEIFASAPTAALEAQAVAARGQLVTKVGTRHLDDPFLLCSEQHCQVYAGKGHEHPRTTKAVVETTGVVAMRPGETQLVDTVYSANSGGHTEHNDHVWPGGADPQLRGRPDPLIGKPFTKGIDAKNIEAWLRESPKSYSLPPEEAGQEPYRWKVEIDPAELTGNREIPEVIGKVQDIEVLKRGRSGRAIEMRVVGDKGAIEIHGELRIRKALGGLKSSMFVVERERGRLQLRGGGHGHGVGMCQHGAMGMARDGKTYKEILSHYYAKARVVKLW